MKYKGSVVHQNLGKAVAALKTHSAIALEQNEIDPLVEHVAHVGPENFAKSSLASHLSIHDVLGAVLDLEAAADVAEGATAEEVAAGAAAAQAAALLRERYALRKAEPAP